MLRAKPGPVTPQKSQRLRRPHVPGSAQSWSGRRDHPTASGFSRPSGVQSETGRVISRSVQAPGSDMGGEGTGPGLAVQTENRF